MILLSMQIETEHLVLRGSRNFDGYMFGIFLKGQAGESIGYISLLSNDLAYEIDEEYQGKGYATEALIAVKNYCMENGISPTVTIDNNGKNPPSRRVAEKAGFTTEPDSNVYNINEDCRNI